MVPLCAILVIFTKVSTTTLRRVVGRTLDLPFHPILTVSSIKLWKGGSMFASPLLSTHNFHRRILGEHCESDKDFSTCFSTLSSPIFTLSSLNLGGTTRNLLILSNRYFAHLHAKLCLHSSTSALKNHVRTIEYLKTTYMQYYLNIIMNYVLTFVTPNT